MVLALTPTGKVLIKMFGKEFYEKIWWDNASPVHGATRDHREKPDLAHIQTVLEQIKPKLVVCFGNSAMEGLVDHESEFEILKCPHPMARGVTSKQFADFAMQVKKFVMAN
jgi:hypothetical protein